VVVEQPATTIATAIATDAAKTVVGRPACAVKAGIVDLSVHRYDSGVALQPVDASTDPARLEALLADVQGTLPDVRLLTDPIDRESYRLDETGYLNPGLPGAVALPASTEDVSGLLRLASLHRVPVVPRGAGTGLSGGAAGIEGALTIALTRMHQILEIDEDNLCVITQPGVINAVLKAAVAEHGLFYPPDPASYETCSIGGNLATNAGGLCCVKYGQTRDWVLGLEVVLADGTVIRTGGKTVKDTAGYSLTHLFVGSEGTLGIITEATLRLRPLPGPRATLLAFFATLGAAGDAVAAMVAGGTIPVTLELMDRETIAAVEDGYHLGLERSAEAMLLIESDAPGAAATAELDVVERACSAAGATMLVRAQDAAEAEMLRAGRRLASDALELQGVVHGEDVGVPRARVPDMLRAIQRISVESGMPIATFGHAGDGNLHPHMVYARGDTAAAARAVAVADRIIAAALELGGTVTAEHGVGAVRRAWLSTQVGEDALAVMRSIKAALDPLGILNPGRVL
jgi:FAD/FMN-containing dehydrogenases